MENAKVVTISELIRRALPHTAASYPGRRTSPSSRDSDGGNSRSSPRTSSPCPSPKVLTALEYPAILIGTLTLPSLTLKCPNKTCLQFSEGSTTICCDIIDVDLRIIGKKIQVHSWNFIPFKHRGGGFLEIIKWEFLDASGGISRCSIFLNSFPLVLGSRNHESKNFKSSYRVHGMLEIVSPVSVVPCSARGSVSSISNDCRGFLVKILSCECELCSSKKSVMDLMHLDCHSFTKPVFIYFCDFAWCWQPIVIKLIGSVITFSGLKKKMVFMGKESELMFLPTENSVLHLLGLLNKWRPVVRNVIKGNGECGIYMGVVRGMYMQGMLVELDKEVWLLLTDQLLTPPHSLRVGAVISARNVHFVNPQFPWAKMLILGSCFRSTITVQSFSPLESGCLILSQSESLLGKFIDSLAFSARFWALLVVLCFRKKFFGILPEKEILGSKHHGGLAQTYASSHLSSSAFRARHGVFMEFYKHGSVCCGNEPYHGGLKLAIPISHFIDQCESIWMRALLKCDNTKSLSCEVASFSCSNRMTFQSEHIGFILVGSLKISSSSGRLQLVDMTGSVDVIVPDIPVTWNHDSIVEVTDYSVVMEGIHDQAHHSVLLDAELFSCRSIFHSLPLQRTRNVAIFVYFQLGDASDRNHPFHPSVNPQEDKSEIRNETFHLIQIVHKFPPLQKFKGISKMLRKYSLFIEAILLPWDLFLAGVDGFMNPDQVSVDQHNGTSRSCLSYSNKRRKSNHTLSRTQADDLMNKFGSTGSEKNSFCSCKESCGKKRCISMGFPCEISCLATIQHDNNCSKIASGVLYCRKADLKFDVDGKTSMNKILMEFDSENYFKYQLFQIGNYYIIKHHKEDPFCKRNECDHISSAKVLVTSRTLAWSLSFSLPINLSLHGSAFNNPFLSDDQVFLANQTEVPQQSFRNKSITHSDVCLHVSAHLLGFLESNFKELHVSLEEPCNLSSCVLNNVAAFSLCSPNLNFLLPEGNLTSLCGDVTAIHSFDLGFGDVSRDLLHCKLHGTSRLCIHVSMNNHMVCVVGFLKKHMYPTGFGPGIRATFHRILELRDQNSLMLTPVSCIVVNSLTPVNEVDTAKCSNSCLASDTNNADSLHSISSGLISDLIQQPDGNRKQLCCRVVSIPLLILEKLTIKSEKLESKPCSRSMIVGIPLAGFVLDDGSASCCCWADGERAARLLGLNEQFPDAAFENSGCRFKWIGLDNDACNSPMSHLKRILMMHGRITVRTCGAVVESYQDQIISVSSGKTLAASDENLLKFVIFNACFSTPWTIVASMMDPDAVSLLEKENLVEAETTEHSMGNIWAREVYYVNQLAESRNILAELSNRIRRIWSLATSVKVIHLQDAWTPDVRQWKTLRSIRKSSFLNGNWQVQLQPYICVKP